MKYLYLFGVFIYILISQFIFISNDLFRYIINPIVWLILLILLKKKNFYYVNKKRILETNLISVLLYQILFYSLGYFVGYGSNTYLTSVNGITINLFSIILVIILKNYIKAILINKKSIYFIIIVTFIIFLSNINLPLIIDLLQDKQNIPLVLIKYILPVLGADIYTSYLGYHGGPVNACLYQAFLNIPSLLVPIAPQYSDLILLIFKLLFPLFTFIIIKNNLHSKDNIQIEKPSKLLLGFTSVFIVMMFSLGAFSIKPSVILTASMRPSLNKGDIVIIKSCDINNITDGTIIRYEHDNYNIIHRVIKTNINQNGIELTVKGDNNIKEDKEKVTSNNLTGCYLFKIKYLGYPSLFIYNILNNEAPDIETGR
ncbi:MAG: signal peptidase I [Bacilli bacterium]|nr:signal peptidase I [Bacilli bacterium]